MPHDLEIDRALLEHLAELARLSLSADREVVLRQQLQRLVDAFSALGDGPAAGSASAAADAGPTAVPTAGSGPPHPPLPLRADEPEAPLPVDRVLANAPRTADGSFVVPRVVDA